MSSAERFGGIGSIFKLLAIPLLFVQFRRAALAIIPVLLAILALMKLNVRAVVAFFAAAILVACIAWFSSPYLRDRTIQLWTDFQNYEVSDERNSSGERLEFWKKAAGFVREAPIFGHGTGSIHVSYLISAADQTGAAGSATTNPHNQTFGV